MNGSVVKSMSPSKMGTNSLRREKSLKKRYKSCTYLLTIMARMRVGSGNCSRLSSASCSLLPFSSCASVPRADCGMAAMVRQNENLSLLHKNEASLNTLSRMI